MKFTKLLMGKAAILAVAGSLALVAGTYAYGGHQGRLHFEESKARLDELSVWSNPLTNSSVVEVIGSNALPGAEIGIFADGIPVGILVGDETAETFIDEDGSTFTVRVALPVEDRLHTITARQVIGYKDLEAASSPTDGVDVILDTVAPTGKLSLRSAIPERTNEATITVRPSVETEDKSAVLRILKDGYPAVYEEAEDGSIEVQLNTGSNALTFVLEDEAGNQSESLYDATISFDGTAPYVTATSTYSCPSSTELKEVVCLDVGQFYGPLYGTAYAPVTGVVKGDVEYVAFNGRYLSVKADGTINQRVAVYVAPGDNTYDIEVGDEFGNIGYGTLSLSWSDEEEDSYDSGPTALCNDGTYSYSQNRSGTCSWHGGVAEWY